MRADRLPFIGVAPLLAMLTFSPDASAFCRTTTVPSSPDDPTYCPPQGQPLYHPSACLTYRIADKITPGTRNTPLEQAYGLSDTMARAFATWTSTNDKCNGISLVELAPLKVDKLVEYVKGGPNHNMIGFVDGPWPHGGGETLSLATLTFDANTGEIFDADLEVNGEVGWVSSSDGKIADNAFDLDSAMLHEAGHFLGIAHASDANAVMFASYTPGEARTALTADDKNAICTAYPSKLTRSTGTGAIPATACNLAPTAAPGTPACGDPDIKHGCAAAPGSSAPGTGTSLIVVAAAAAIVVSRRRRQA